MSRLLYHKACPSCQAKGEDNSENNLGVYDDGHSYCFKEGLLFPAHEVFNPLVEEFTYEYIPLRGLTKDTLRFYDVKTKVDTEGRPLSIGFRFANDSYKVRYLDRKDFYTQGEIAKGGLFGKDKFSAGSHKYITITEGEFDAATLYQVLRSPCVSVQSASTAKRDCTVDYDYLNSFERIYVAFDGDNAGKEALRSIAGLFDYNKLYVVRFTSRKDANDYLVAGESDELLNIWNNSRKYLPEDVISSFVEFQEILKEPIARGFRIYPSHTLNEMTDGIRTSESVLVTAPEGVGKTELMHHIEYNFLKETDHGVAAIYLEEPKRRHLQAIAGLELGRPVHLPDSGATSAQLLAALQKVVVRDDRLHIYSHFGSDDPGVLTDIIRFLVVGRGVKLVLLDHITMAVSGLAGEDERKALDWLSTRLEMMVKELDFALVLVSHVNDFGQTRGSRYISKVADIRIDMSRDILSSDPFVRNIVRFVIPKNRPIGKTGPAGEVLYNSVTGRYEEPDVFQPPQNAIETAAGPYTQAPYANDNQQSTLQAVA